MTVDEVAPGIFRLRDTCNVYVIRVEGSGGQRTGIAIDFGSGEVLDHLAEMGVDRLTDVLMTHHHRDQGQGLWRAAAAGIPIHVPPVEQELFASVDEMWQSHPLYNDYNLRQDRFSLLDAVPVTGVVPEYRWHDFHGVTVYTMPTPGHTIGSVSYLVDRPGGRVAFTGDLIYAPGKVWSLAATQWSYTENEGPAMAVLSCYLLLKEPIGLILPSHGEPMPDAHEALTLLAERMQSYVDSRRTEPWDLRARLEDPFVRLTEHLLLNRTANSCSYVVLSASGAALIIDFGYDMTTGWAAGTDRASRRPLLASLPALRRDYQVTDIEVALATHYHDDHVAGLNLLREVEGTEIWLPENVAPIMADPMRTDLPCQWFDPTPADLVMPLGQTVPWREYQFIAHELPGHTLYAAAFEFVVDGVRVLATGDQQTGLGVPGESREILNYQYRNRFRSTDYQDSAALYRRVAPGLMISGHWKGRWVDEAYLHMLEVQGDELAQLHEDLLPDDGLSFGADGVVGRLEPYFTTVAAGSTVDYTATVHNPFADEREVRLSLVVPEGWSAAVSSGTIVAGGHESVSFVFSVTVGRRAARHQRLAVDLTIGDERFGQQAEAVVTVQG